MLYSSHMELLKHALPWIQIILSVVLIALILLQRSGAELGGAFGGGDAGGGTLYTRRGAERMFFFATIVCGALFIAVNFAALLLGK
jgi:protein translocase SecG subunit